MAITLKRPAQKFDHYIGSLDAPVILVEYGDVEDPDTARALNVTDKLITEFRDDLCFVFRHYPNPDTHPNSVLASIALEAAHAQGMFWKMFRQLLHHQDELSANFIVDAAKTIGLNEEQFLKDLESEEYLLRIQQDIESGEESGVEDTTPTFFLNGIMVDPPTNYNLLRDEIQSLLRETPMSYS